MRSSYKNKIELDNEKRVIKMETPLEGSLYFKYDNIGRMIEVTDNESYLGIYNYIDSKSNKIKNFTDTDGVEITYAYEGDKLCSMIIYSLEYNNQYICLNANTLLSIKGKDSNQVESLRIIDDLGYVIDYCTNLNRNKSEIYGIRSIKYEVNKLDNETIEVSYTKKTH